GVNGVAASTEAAGKKGRPGDRGRLGCCRGALHVERESRSSERKESSLPNPLFSKW
ncbi:hypothetical protein IscW_ISCW013926, partial [Ixodes scapularis]